MAKRRRKIGKKGHGKLKIHPEHELGKTMRKRSRRKRG
jgi:hypothetical protein